MRLGIIGQPCIDEIVAINGTLQSLSLGGILYSYAAMEHSMRKEKGDSFIGLSWKSLPDASILDPFLTSLRHLEPKPQFSTSHLTNRVRLIYASDSSRSEECSIILPPLTQREISQVDLRSLDGIFINMISGFDLMLETLEWMRANTSAHIHLDVHALVLGDISQRNGSARIPRGVDHWQRWLSCVDSIQLNELETQWFASPEITNENVLIDHVRLVRSKALVITRAERGASCYVLDKEYHTQAPSTSIIDTTGSGDVFGSVFLYRYLQSHDYESALSDAVEAASRNCEIKGVEGWLA